jgi:phosphatidylglycerol lysyltransferase
VLRHGWHPSAYQILNPGIRHWFAASGDAVVGYSDHRGVRVVAGEPVCAADALAGVVTEFEGDTRAARRRACYLAAEERLASLTADDGRYVRVIVGAHPMLRPARWPDTVAARGSLRAQLNRARNKGVAVHEWTTSRATASSELRAVLRRWLSARGLPPLHFLVESDTLTQLADRRVFVATRHADVAGFLVATPIPARNGWLVEQVVRVPDAPNGTTELLHDEAVRVLGAAGATIVALGVAPLSVRAGPTRGAPWHRGLLAWQRAHGRRFYNFAGLEAFKAKFEPDRWAPVFPISHEPRFRFGTLYAIASAYCGGSPIRAGARAVVHAVRQELRWIGGPRA